MTSFQDAVYDAARQAICFAGRSAQQGYDTLGPLAGPGGDVGQQLAGEVQQGFCGEPPPPPLPPPFEGGQCPVLYDISFQVLADSTDQGGATASPPQPEQVQGVGPLQVVPAEINPSIRGFTVQGPGGTSYSTRFIGTNPVGLRYELTATRADGNPDDCGNPPLPPPTGAPYPSTNTNITYNNFEGDSQTTNVNLTFAPAYVDVDGSINVPVTVEVSPDITFEGNLNLNGRVGLGFGAGGLIPSGQGEPGETPPPEEGRRCLVGLYVEVNPTPAASASELFRDGSDTLYVPRLAQVFFTSDLGGQPYRSVAFNVQKRDTILIAPQDFCWTGFEVALEPGVDLDSTAPVYRTEG